MGGSPSKQAKSAESSHSLTGTGNAPTNATHVDEARRKDLVKALQKVIPVKIEEDTDSEADSVGTSDSEELEAEVERLAAEVSRLKDGLDAASDKRAKAKLRIKWAGKVQILQNKVGKMIQEIDMKSEEDDPDEEQKPARRAKAVKQLDLGVLEYGLHDAQGRTHYRGQMYSEKRHGLGVLKYLDGTMYEGEWEDDQASGFGIESLGTDGQEIYRGQFTKGKRCRRGVQRRKDGTVISALWDNNLPHGAGVSKKVAKDGTVLYKRFVRFEKGEEKEEIQTWQMMDMEEFLRDVESVESDSLAMAEAAQRTAVEVQDLVREADVQTRGRMRVEGGGGDLEGGGKEGSDQEDDIIEIDASSRQRAAKGLDNAGDLPVKVIKGLLAGSVVETRGQSKEDKLYSGGYGSQDDDDDDDDDDGPAGRRRSRANSILSHEEIFGRRGSVQFSRRGSTEFSRRGSLHDDVLVRRRSTESRDDVLVRRSASSESPTRDDLGRRGSTELSRRASREASRGAPLSRREGVDRGSRDRSRDDEWSRSGSTELARADTTPSNKQGSPLRASKDKSVGSPLRASNDKSVGSPLRASKDKSVGSPLRASKDKSVGSPLRASNDKSAALDKSASPTRSAMGTSASPMRGESVVESPSARRHAHFADEDTFSHRKILPHIHVKSSGGGGRAVGATGGDGQAQSGQKYEKTRTHEPSMQTRVNGKGVAAKSGNAQAPKSGRNQDLHEQSHEQSHEHMHPQHHHRAAEQRSRRIGRVYITKNQSRQQQSSPQRTSGRASPSRPFGATPSAKEGGSVNPKSDAETPARVQADGSERGRLNHTQASLAQHDGDPDPNLKLHDSQPDGAHSVAIVKLKHAQDEQLSAGTELPAPTHAGKQTSTYAEAPPPPSGRGSPRLLQQRLSPHPSQVPGDDEAPQEGNPRGELFHSHTVGHSLLSYHPGANYMGESVRGRRTLKEFWYQEKRNAKGGPQYDFSGNYTVNTVSAYSNVRGNKPKPHTRVYAHSVARQDGEMARNAGSISNTQASKSSSHRKPPATCDRSSTEEDKARAQRKFSALMPYGLDYGGYADRDKARREELHFNRELARTRGGKSRAGQAHGMGASASVWSKPFFEKKEGVLVTVYTKPYNNSALADASSVLKPHNTGPATWTPSRLDYSEAAWAVKHRVQTARPRTAIRRVMVMQAEIRLRNIERMKKRKELLERRKKEEEEQVARSAHEEAQRQRQEELHKKKVQEYGMAIRHDKVKPMTEMAKNYKHRKIRTKLPPVGLKVMHEGVKKFVIRGQHGEEDRAMYFSAEQGAAAVFEAYKDVGVYPELPTYIFMPIKPAQSLVTYNNVHAKKSLSSALGFSSRDFLNSSS